MRKGEDVNGKASMKLGNGEKGKGREGRLRGKRKEKGWRGKGDRRVGGALVLPCSCRWQSRRPWRRLVCHSRGPLVSGNDIISR